MQNIKLILGDCISSMQKMPDNSVDMLFTDLPYGTTKCKWDTPIDLAAFWKEANRVVKDNGCKAMYCQIPFSIVLGNSNLKELRYDWIWEKNQATGHLNAKKMPMKAHEQILIFYKSLPTYHPQMTHGHPRKVSTVEHKKNCVKSQCYGEYHFTTYDSTDRYPRSVLRGPTDKQKNNLRVAQKPIWLCEELIRTYTDEGETVLDCCMGTASIGVACMRTNRNYIGIDLDPEVFEIAKSRLQASSTGKT